MKFLLDEPTIMTICGMASLVASGMFFVLAKPGRELAGLRYWAIGSLGIGFAMVVGGPNLIADWQYASLAFNIPFSCGKAFMLAGTMQFCHRPYSRRVLAVMVGAVLAFSIGFTYILPDAHWRIPTLALVHGTATLWMGVILWRHPDPYSRRAFRVASAMSLLEATGAFVLGTLIATSTGQLTYSAPEVPLATFIAWNSTLLNALVGNALFYLLIALRLIQELRRAAERDALTGVLNRRGIRLHLESLFAHARGQRDIAFLMLDIDHFKAVNDTHGHDVGDRVLTALGNVLLRAATPSIVPARWGGEEFCIVAEGAAPSALAALAQAIRTEFQRASAAMPELPGGKTLSIGIAYAPLRDLSQISALVTATDAELYKAKRAGRDRISIATPDAVEGGRNGRQSAPRELVDA